MNYSVNNIYEYDKSSNDIVEVFKSKFMKNSLNELFESKITKFYEELLLVSKSFGLGENISIDMVYDGSIPEWVFTINAPYNLNFDDRHYFSGEIIEHMGNFSRKEYIFDFFKDAYVLVK